MQIALAKERKKQGPIFNPYSICVICVQMMLCLLSFNPWYLKILFVVQSYCSALEPVASSLTPISLFPPSILTTHPGNTVIYSFLASFIILLLLCTSRTVFRGVFTLLKFSDFTILGISFFIKCIHHACENYSYLS